MGNSNGVIIPKPLLAQLGIGTGDSFDLSVEGDRLVLAPSAGVPRAGWAEEAREIAEAGDDALAWPEFGNEIDAELIW
jgi:antitoxin MazE